MYLPFVLLSSLVTNFGSVVKCCFVEVDLIPHHLAFVFWGYEGWLLLLPFHFFFCLIARRLFSPLEGNHHRLHHFFLYFFMYSQP